MSIPRRTLLATSAAAPVAGALLGSIDSRLVGTAEAAGPGRRPRKPAKLNHPPLFFRRPGLEKMPRFDYSSMPIVNVRDHGATGTGKTDDKPAFAKALAALKAQGGGVLYMPAGDYLFALPDGARGTVPLWALGEIHNIHFLGDGEQSCIWMELPHQTSTEHADHPVEVILGWDVKPIDSSFRSFAMQWTPYYLGRYHKNLYSMHATNGDRVSFVDLHLDQGQPALWMPFGKRYWVVDCVSRNSSADAFHFESGIDSVMAYNFTDNAHDDAYAGYTNTRQTPDPSVLGPLSFISNTVIQTAYGRGITWGGSDHTIRNCWIEAQNMAGLYSDVGLWEGAPDAPLINAVGEGNTLVRTGLADRADNPNLGYGTGGYQGGISLKDEIKGLRLSNNAVLGSEMHGIIFGIEGWRPLNGHDIVLDANVIDDSRQIGVRFLPTATIDGLTMRRNRIVDSEVTDVSMEGKITDLETFGNLVHRRPVITGDVQGDRDGFRVTHWDSPYVDHYAWIRRAAPDTSALDVGAQTRRLPAGKKTWNVKQFGATGDGRSNDLAAIAKAISKLKGKQGGTLHFPRGTYRIGATSGLDHTAIRHHLALVGAHNIRITGPGATLRFDNPDAVGLRLVGCTDVTIEGLTLEGPGPRKLRHNRALLEVSGCRRVLVSTVTARESAGAGIRLDSSMLVALRECTIRRAGCSGVDISACRQVLVTGCDIDKARDNGVFVTWMGSIALMPQYITISRNTITGTTEGGGIGITSGDQVTVANNKIRDTYLAGIWAWSRSPQYPQRRVTVRGNTLIDTNRGERTYTPGAISLIGLSKATRYSDFTITGNRVQRTPWFGVWVGGSPLTQSRFSELERLVIRDNTVTGSGAAAVGMPDGQLAHVADSQVNA